MSQDIEQFRAGFEAWLKARPGYPFAGAFANLMWESWLAAKLEASTEPSTQGFCLTARGLSFPDGSHITPDGDVTGPMAHAIAAQIKGGGALLDEAKGAAPGDALDARLVPCSYRVNQYKIDEVGQIEGPALWAVRVNGNCLNKFGALEWEPNPSGRDEDFLGRCRFASARDALICLDSAIATSTAPVDPRLVTGTGDGTVPRGVLLPAASANKGSANAR